MTNGFWVGFENGVKKDKKQEEGGGFIASHPPRVFKEWKAIRGEVFKKSGQTVQNRSKKLKKFNTPLSLKLKRKEAC